MKQPLTLAPDIEHFLWARNLFGHAQLPDPRLIRRAVSVAANLAARPIDSIPQACGVWSEAKATYRFLENDRVSIRSLINSVSKAAVAACQNLNTVYAIQDTTSFNFNTLKQTKGLGPIGDKPVFGIHLHSVLALSPLGIPLGLLDMNFWTRDITQHGKRVTRQQRPIEEKESYRWLTSARAAHEALASLEVPPRLVHVCDREGDIHEFFAEILSLGDEAVIRCAHDRVVEGEAHYAHAAVRAAALMTSMELTQKRTPQFPERTARVEIRAVQVILQGSKNLRSHKPLNLSLVEIWEPDPPSEEQRLHWRLWTTLPISSVDEVLDVIRIYKLRWRIEEVHLAVKSGCAVEKLQLGTSARLCKALSIYMAVAVRIVALKDLVRQTPDAPCTVVFSTLEWQALWARKHRKHCPVETEIPTLQKAVGWMAQLGGHLGRKGDGSPGVRALWRGWRDLQLLAEGYRFHA
jgi:hypothetical protein